MHFWKKRELKEEIDDLNQDDLSEDEERIIGYRYEATGAFGYEFYAYREKLCTISDLSFYLPTIGIDGYDWKWKSDFDEYHISYVGQTRYIYDRETETEITKLVFMGKGKYVLGDSTSVCNYSAGQCINCADRMKK